MAEFDVNGATANNSSQMGQGMAYILPDTRSDKYLMQIATDDRDKQYQARAQKEQQAAARAAQINKTLTDKFASPDSWRPFNKLVGDRWDQWNREAVTLKAQGTDPTNDPDMLKKYNDIVNIAQYSNGLKDQYVKELAAIQTNPDKYDRDAEAKLNQQYQEALSNPQDWYGQARTFSGLPARQATFDQLLKDVKIGTTTTNDGRMEVKAPNAEGVRQQIMGNILNDPNKWGHAARRYNVDLAYVPVTSPWTGKIMTDEQEIKRYVQQLTQSPDKLKATLGEFNVPDNEVAAEYLVDKIAQVNTPFSEMVDDLTNRSLGTADTGNKRVFTAEQNDRANRQLQLSEEAANQRREKFAKWTKDKNGNDIRGQWIRDIQSGKDNAISRLNAALTEVGGNVVHEKGNTYVEIPIKTDYNTLADSRGGTVRRTMKQRFRIGKGSGEAGRDAVNIILNKLPSVGKEKMLSVEDYGFDQLTKLNNNPAGTEEENMFDD